MGKGGPPGGAMPPAEVGVVTIAPERVSLTVELPGRATPVRVAQVRARTTGILLHRLFEEGADVKAGQVLFEIDPALLQATRDNAKASLARTEATVEQAKAKAKRNEDLVKISGVSKQAWEDAKAVALQSEADVLAAKAALETAELNLSYAKVAAPIAGRIGKALATEGALVSATEATQLAVIRQLDPIYVDFTRSSTEMLKLRRTLEAGRVQGVASKEARVSLVLEDGSIYAQPGRILFSDIAVEEDTGSVTLRAEFPNPDGMLLPGMFVRGRIEIGVEEKAILVPQRGVARDATGHASVLVVNGKNEIEQHPIQTGGVHGDNWIVESGVAPADRIIVEGLQKVRPGMTVVPVPFVKPGATNAAPAGAASTHP